MLYTTWDWISRACRFNGLERSARKAKELDEVVSKLYSRKFTPHWIEYYCTFNLTRLRDIRLAMLIANFCVPCYEAGNASCRNCLLANKDSDCDNQNSKYYKFIKEFREEVRDAFIDIQMMF